MAIVSHKHKFIFLKTRKTAGSSIEIWLSTFLSKEDMAALTADLEVFRPELVGHFSPKGLKPHATATQVQMLVGEEVWRDYFKFAVERNPFDRIISLWRWRQHIKNISVTFDEFLDAIIDGSSERRESVGANDWSNWPIYTIDDTVVVDDLIDYADLLNGVSNSLRKVGIDFDHDLPRAKSGIRHPSDSMSNLSHAQRAKIESIFFREINLLKYQ